MCATVGLGINPNIRSASVWCSEEFRGRSTEIINLGCGASDAQVERDDGPALTTRMHRQCPTCIAHLYNASMPSFDIVSQVDMQEVRNAVDQSMREVISRYDFKGTDSSVRLTDEGVVVESSAEGRLEAAVDVLKGKLVRRKVSLKSIAGGERKQIGGGRYRAVFTLNEGIAQDAAKELSKNIRDMKLKVQVQIQGDQLRVSSKKRDELQNVIAAVKALDFRLPLQYVNFRD